MALLRTRKGRADGGYTRLFGDPQVGLLFSRVQAAVISAGEELQKAITELSNTIEDVDAFLNADILPAGTFVVTKRQLKKSRQLNYAGVEPDFLVFQREGKRHHCYLVELKDGDTFDTKKAAGERESLHRFMVAVAPHIQFSMSIHFCCFNRSKREEIVHGFKRKITIDEAMTGPEFCELLELDYQSVVAKRKEHQEENLRYFVEELARIPSMRAILSDMIQSDTAVSEEDEDPHSSPQQRCLEFSTEP